MQFPGIAKAEGVAPDSQVTVRPVDEVSEETVLREAAELAEGTPVTEQPGESDEDSGTVRPTACSERGDHYPVSNKKDLFIPVGIDFKSGPGGTTTAAVQRTLATSLSVQLGATFKAGAIVASAEANMSITGTVTATIQETHTYSHNISANKYGHLRYGNWGWKMDPQKFTMDAN
jgi:hypothetical protein